LKEACRTLGGETMRPVFAAPAEVLLADLAAQNEQKHLGQIFESNF
jgi:hypothetical protein